MRLTAQLVLPAILALHFCSCGGGDPSRKATYPVRGEICVDGAPAPNLAVRCTNINGLDKEQPTTSSALTDDEGRFEISTYQSGDGVPEGEYVLTFEWGQWNKISGGYGGPDRLKKKYLDPDESEHKFTVVKGQATELGRIELTTK